MNISELSIQLRELSDNYSRQQIVLGEYRLKRKYILDEVDQTFNNQSCANTLQDVEEAEKSNDMDNLMPEVVNKIFEKGINNDGDE